MKWRVGSPPLVNGCFYSPWFGIESSDNLNLLQVRLLKMFCKKSTHLSLQPVNPWESNSWHAYTEYFQWSPVYNYDSESFPVSPGDILRGTVLYNQHANAYEMIQHDLTSNRKSVSRLIPVESGRKFQIIYVVQEKVCDCSQYSADRSVLFYDIEIEFDHRRVFPQWKTAFVDDVCGARAKVINDTAIEITWKN